MLIFGLKLGLLMLSYLGYWEFFRSRWKINVYFLPAFTLAVHFAVMFVAGILNFLGLMAVVIYLLGLALLGLAIKREKLNVFIPYLNCGYIVFAAFMLLAAAVLKNKLFFEHDDFSHWATVVKNMLAADQFPTFAQSAVSFQEYPLGSSTLIYYFAKMTSRGEDIQMLAQSFLSLSMLLPVFAACRKNAAQYAAIVVLMNFLLCYNIQITSLLVDSLLPLSAAAAIWFLYVHCISREEPLPISLGFPLLFLTMNIKSSGILFVALAIGMLLIHYRRDRKRTAMILKTAMLCLIGFFLWKRHCAYVFDNAKESLHAVSMTLYQQRFAEKTMDDILSITTRTFRFAFVRKSFYYLLGWLAVLGLGTMFSDAPMKRRFKRLLTFVSVFYVVYVAGTAGMFLFSMNTQAARALECIDRYMRTADIMVYYLCFVFGLALAGSEENRVWQRAASGLLLAAMVITWGAIQYKTIVQAPYAPERRLEIVGMLEQYGVPKGYSYLILSESSDYATYVCRYYFDTSRVVHVQVTKKKYLETEKDYDFVIILDEGNPLIEEWLQEKYPDQADQKIIYCIK